MPDAPPKRQRHPFPGMGKYVKGMNPACRVKDVDSKEGIVTGYFAAFNNIDSDGDYIVPGAFTKAIESWGPQADRRVKHLFHHNPMHGVGVIRELAEDSYGLRFVSKMLSSDQGRNALIELEEGHITEHSFGYDVIQSRLDEDRGAVALRELRLYEGSGVTWGANQQTPVVSIKALQNDGTVLDNMILKMRSIKRVLKRGITDERAKELETELKSYEHFCSELRKALYKTGPLAVSQEGTRTEPPSQADVSLAIIKSLNQNLTGIGI